ncbi:oxidoreductase protein [Ketogulonicigenium robustum]|uniref:Oxidoreductase protein n=1 Tax=Ketogulonicigenium robustum TaxID=92947 RepID=A0A1W6P004_9RHOB|nr:NAD(P)/FAD-dependent oxidoreductase [Ketogulonicigenium robustum]ARO14733.1 oxidoreductase protein [Ketogulonicigenium robustum]
MGALAALQAQVASELDRIEGLACDWLPARAPDSYDVVICGAGLAGLGVAFGLKRRGINNVLVIDQRPKGQEGPWVTAARMKTLRSPKHLASVDLGVPSLTLRAWYEATYGTAAWDALDKPAKEDWMRYLIWFRAVTGLHVENDTTLVGLAPAPSGVRLELATPTGRKYVQAGHVVMATGLVGSGAAWIPPEIAALPRDMYTHSADICSDAGLAGRDVAVIGGATSAFDWSVTALERGARSVTHFARRAGFAATEGLAWMNFPGFLGHYADLPDDHRWRYMHRYFTMGIPPTQDQYNRAAFDPRFHYHAGAGASHYSLTGSGRVRIENACGTFEVDQLLLGTGYTSDLSARPELSSVAGLVKLWGDVYTPPAALGHRALAAHPYLGYDFELLPHDPAQVWISRIHMFNAAAMLSFGPVANGITGAKYGIPMLVTALARQLFQENRDHFLAAYEAFNDVHFVPRSDGKDNA